jgi:hypothetical protein
MIGRINVAEGPEFMVSPCPPSPVEEAKLAWIPRPNSPLENTPHKAGNGEISITCGSRHCPKCQTNARDKWLTARSKELLPVRYVHVVFTLPHELSWLILHNKKVIYDLLFRTTAATLLEIAADPRHLGAEIGFLSVLHTWGQTLQHHPHIHCVIPSGGLSLDHQCWVHPRYPFFLPVVVLRRVFRGKFVDGLKDTFQQGKLVFPGSLRPLAAEKAFAAFLRPLFRKEWVVYSNAPSADRSMCSTTWHAIPTASPSPIIGSCPWPMATSHFAGKTTHTAASNARCRSPPKSSCVASCSMSYRAGSSEFAFQASWLTGAGDNFCPSVNSCWRPLHRNPRRRLEAARQSPPQLGSVLAVAAPWWSSRNSPLNRSAGDLLTGSISLTVRSRYSASNLQRASACTLYVCPCWREPVPFGAERIQFKAKPTPSKLPGPSTPAFSTPGNELHTRTRRRPPVPEVSESIEYP